MANTKSAKKRARQIEKRTATNRARRTRVRTFLKKVETEFQSFIQVNFLDRSKVSLAGSSDFTVKDYHYDGKKKEAAEALRAAQPEVMRGVTRGVIKKNTATRKLSRLSARIKAL